MGRKNPRAYYDYGEGSVLHGRGEECALGRSHPAIQRTEYPSRWAYLRRRIGLRLYSRGAPRGTIIEGGTFRHAWWLEPLAREAFRQYPTIWVDMKNEDSIYERDDE